MKKRLIERLKEEQRYGDFLRLKNYLRDSGIAANIAWRIAAYRFPPADGSTPEIFMDGMYAEIAAKWAAGKYPQPPEFKNFPNGLPDFRNPIKTPEAEALVEEVKATPKKYQNKYEKIAAQVDPAKTSSEVEIIRWAFNHYLDDVEDIPLESIPCVGALGLLLHLHRDESNYGDFVKTNWSRIVPTGKELGQDTGRNDDGRILANLKAFDDEFASEGEDGEAA